MRGQFSAGGIFRRATSNESGAVLVVMAAVCVALSLLFAGICEFGRFLLMREQTQTAADAAALAGAVSGVKRWVNITVFTDRGDRLKCNKFGCWCESCGVVGHTVTGRERKLLDEEGWRDYCEPPCSCGGGSCWYVINDRWVTYDSGNSGWSRLAAEAFYYANEPLIASDSQVIRTVFHSSRSDPAYPSVTVYGRSWLSSLFPGFLDVFPESYKTDVCAQGQTYYHPPYFLKWTRAPERACWKD